uniref:Uncharacterized protein n=1 Tax=Fagus sylvatica TaxID=28930 RepID=A0A2N9GQH0_FAGSY
MLNTEKGKGNILVHMLSDQSSVRPGLHRVRHRNEPARNLLWFHGTCSSSVCSASLEKTNSQAPPRLELLPHEPNLLLHEPDLLILYLDLLCLCLERSALFRPDLPFSQSDLPSMAPICLGLDQICSESTRTVRSFFGFSPNCSAPPWPVKFLLGLGVIFLGFFKPDLDSPPTI